MHQHSKSNYFFKTWERHAHKYINPFTDKKPYFDILKNTQFIELMERAPCVVFIINHATSKYEFFSKNVKSMMGYTSEEMIAGGVPFGMSLIEETHMEIIAKCVMPAMFEHFAKYPQPQDLKRIRLSYNFKYRRKDGNYVWTLHQMSIIETDETGGPLLSIVFMSDISVFKKDDLLDFSVSKLSQEGYYEPVFTTSYPTAKEMLLTPREWEIVSLITLGNTSSEIADQLSISTHTVKTHRKNILEKFDASNTPNLLEICRRKGLA